MTENELSRRSELVEAALDAGVLILENGGETYRAEETVTRMCEASGLGQPDVLALPTGIFLTLRSEGIPPVTSVRRVSKRSVNLFRLERANAAARLYSSGKIPLKEVRERISALSDPGNSETFPRKLLLSFLTGISSALFTLLLSGSLFDALAALIAGFTVQFFASLLKFANIYQFAVSFLGGLIIALYAVGAVTIFRTGNIESIIAGASMPFLPGLALTNSIRDTVMGDLVSGTARGAEALLIAVSLAAGVGCILSIYLGMGGVIA